MPDLTPTEQRIVAVLSDGLPHRRDELMACLNDELTTSGTLRVHLHFLRKKLRPIGQDIVTEVPNGRTIHFRHVRMLASTYDGYR